MNGCARFLNSGINAEMEYKKKNKFQKSFKECNENDSVSSYFG